MCLEEPDSGGTCVDGPARPNVCEGGGAKSANALRIPRSVPCHAVPLRGVRALQATRPDAARGPREASTGVPDMDETATALRARVDHLRTSYTSLRERYRHAEE